MIDYKKIWASINTESESNTEETQIARKIPSENIFSVFLATDFRKGIRLLYIKLNDGHNIIPENLQGFRGLEISISASSIGEYVNKEFLQFKQTIPKTENIFESVIADICDRTIAITNIKHLNAVLVKVLQEWNVFFEKNENEILSTNKQKGLYGELTFMKKFLFQKYSYSDSVHYWTGAKRTNHDFQIKDNCVEVKTTSTKQHKKFFISSEKQLDTTGIEALYLSLFAINVHANIPSKTLPALIKLITHEIKDDSIAVFQFEIKLAKYGYNRLHADKYTMGFSTVNITFFEIVDGFPRLLQANLPVGIGDLEYSIVVAACSPYEIKTNILKLI